MKGKCFSNIVTLKFSHLEDTGLGGSKWVVGQILRLFWKNTQHWYHLDCHGCNLDGTPAKEVNSLSCRKHGHFAKACDKEPNRTYNTTNRRTNREVMKASEKNWLQKINQRKKHYRVREIDLHKYQNAYSLCPIMKPSLPTITRERTI